jgi:hypothetical protein
MGFKSFLNEKNVKKVEPVKKVDVAEKVIEKQPKKIVKEEIIAEKDDSSPSADIMKRAAMIYEGLPQPKKVEIKEGTKPNLASKFGDIVGRAAQIL